MIREKPEFLTLFRMEPNTLQATLFYQLVSYEGREEGTYLELIKDFEIDFIPVAGMELHFGISAADLSEEVAEMYECSLEDAVEIATGIFTIEKVAYLVSRKELRVYAESTFETIAGLASVIDQLILGYGFEPN